MNSHKGVMVVFVSLLFLAALAEPHYASGKISSFDSEGNANAYIADDLTIYLWEGDPVAYLFGSSGGVHVCDFDGNHLGWFENGIVRDHDGKAVGAIKGAVSTITSIEPIKGQIS